MVFDTDKETKKKESKPRCKNYKAGDFEFREELGW